MAKPIKHKHKGTRIHPMTQVYLGESDIHLFDLTVAMLYCARYQCDCGYELQYLEQTPGNLLAMPKTLLIKEEDEASKD